MKTPGVYVKEIRTLPPSVVGVDTAIPVFIGYTEKTENAGEDLLNKPTRIRSMVEFESLFGGRHMPGNGELTIKLDDDNRMESVTPDKRFYLYDAVRMYYDNGGGSCYILSAGDYEQSIDATALEKGLQRIKKFDEPTLILFPDAVGLVDSGAPDKDAFADLQKKALSQCKRLKDRFAILDIIDGYRSESVSHKPVSDFRDNIGNRGLSYGAVYYPWLVTTYPFELGYRMLSFKDSGDSDVAVSDLPDELLGTDEEKALISNRDDRFDELEKLVASFGVQDDKDGVIAGGSQYLQNRLNELKEDLSGKTSGYKTKFTRYLSLLSGAVNTFKAVEDHSGLHSDLKDLVSSLQDDDDLVEAITAVIRKELNTDVLDFTDREEANLKNTIYNDLSETSWLKDGKKIDDLDTDSTDYSSKIPADVIEDLKDDVSKILNAFARLYEEVTLLVDRAEEALFSDHRFFRSVRERVVRHMQMQPPSGAIAGIYAQTDRTRGVWKAPANVSLTGVSAPAVKLDDAEQAGLNVHTSGKSVNAIRSFTGKGILVWGSRTLAGNDNEWRYIPVRRFFIMVEESLRKAFDSFVFETNDANTWVKARSMTENFLTLQWRAGALQGATPEEAFFVSVGLGETMTAQDILEGRMIVEIGMAAVRPAEFIILKFIQKMPES